MSKTGRLKTGDWRLTLVAPALLVVSAFAGASPLADDDLGVTGYVLAPDGAPVSSGTVVDQLAFASGTIDQTGRFRVVPPRAGFHPFLVTVPGFAPYRFAVTVPPSRTLRLPVIRLTEGAFFRVRLVSASGLPILAAPLHRHMFDTNGGVIDDGLGFQFSSPSDTDGTITMGPLPRGIMTLAADVPTFAQTRLPDANAVDPTKNVDAGTIVIQQPGAAINVTVVDGAGVAVQNHRVLIEDPRPRSPMVFPPLFTDAKGHVTFDRLAAGQYRVSSLTADRCAFVWLSTSRLVQVATNGTIDLPLVIGGRATFHITSPLGPEAGAQISAAPGALTPPTPSRARATMSGCRGGTDRDGRVTLTPFPPGPAHIEVQLTNSVYLRQVEVPLDQREIAIAIPDGFLPVHVVSDKNEPVRGAVITWTGGGARVEASVMAAGDALLQGVGSASGTLSVSAPGYQLAEESLDEPPGVLHTVVLTRLPPPARVRARVTTTAGEPLRDAVVEFVSMDPAAVPRIAVTDAKGAITFGDMPPASGQLIVSADGFATSIVGVPQSASDEIAIALARGYRAIADLDLALTAGPQIVRVMNGSNRSMDDVLDLDSDRRVEPHGHLSLGPLVPGTYVIELQGSAGRRQERIRIVDRDVNAIIR